MSEKPDTTHCAAIIAEIDLLIERQLNVARTQPRHWIKSGLPGVRRNVEWWREEIKALEALRKHVALFPPKPKTMNECLQTPEGKKDK